MALLKRAQRLRKELGVVGAYAIATGATFSSGFFLLPGLAAAEVGPALVLSYLVAAIPIFPAALCMVELATAMPRAGGAYFFFDRSMGPLLGTIGGAGTWLVLVLKTCFALVGMGAYLHLLEPRLPITWLAAGLALFFGVLNLMGARGTASTQIVLVGGLLSIVGWFLFSGMRSLESSHFEGMSQVGFDSIIATGGMVFISYVGVTKVASMAEEIRNPERNLPLAVFASLGTAVVVYALGTIVMVGVVPPRELAGDLTPVATAASVVAGPWGRNLLAVAALLAFSSVANAGILSASRYPLAMSRDHLLPSVVRKLSSRRIPYVSVCGTVAAVLVALALLDPAKIAKLGSAFQLVVFALICLAVIIMRESKIESYDPAFRSPFYPYLQIAGIATPLLFIADMGWLSIGFCLALPLLCGIWYHHFARTRVARSGAIRHVFHHLGERRFGGLDTELRVILKEKGLRSGDPFEQVVAHAMFVEAPAGTTFRDATRLAAERLAPLLAESVDSTIKNFLDGTAVGATPTAKGAALPHFRHPELEGTLLCIVRCLDGIPVDPDDPLWSGHAPGHPIHAFFFLVSNETDPAVHLRILAQIAERVDDDGFISMWLSAEDELSLKELLLRDRHFQSLTLVPGTPSGILIGRALEEIDLSGCLMSHILREGQILVPHGSTVLQEMDRVTILGQAADIETVRRRFAPRVVATASEREGDEVAGGRPSLPPMVARSYENILCFFNVEVDDQDALELPAALAEAHGSRLTVVDVQKELSWYARLVEGADEEGMLRMVRNREAVLRDQLGTLRAGAHPVELRVLLGSPFIEVIREVVRNQHDLVVAAGQLGKGLEAAFFGSTAAHLVRKCPCPVWLVMPSAKARPKKVLAAVSPDPESVASFELNLKIVRHAQLMVDEREGELVILHVWDEGVYRFRPLEMSESQHKKTVKWLEQEVDRKLRSFLLQAGLDGLSNKVRLVRGQPGLAIPAFAKRNGVDLIVLGSVGRVGARGMFIGNVAEAVLQDAPCSLLTVKPDGFVTPVQLADDTRA